MKLCTAVFLNVKIVGIGIQKLSSMWPKFLRYKSVLNIKSLYKKVIMLSWDRYFHDVAKKKKKTNTLQLHVDTWLWNGGYITKPNVHEVEKPSLSPFTQRHASFDKNSPKEKNENNGGTHAFSFSLIVKHFFVILLENTILMGRAKELLCQSQRYNICICIFACVSRMQEPDIRRLTPGIGLLLDRKRDAFIKSIRCFYVKVYAHRLLGETVCRSVARILMCRSM